MPRILPHKSFSHFLQKFCCLSVAVVMTYLRDTLVGEKMYVYINLIISNLRNLVLNLLAETTNAR